MLPVATGGFTAPNPVARITTLRRSPILAGCGGTARPETDPIAHAKAPSLLPYAIARPLAEKIPGAAEVSGALTATEAAPPLVTTTCADVPVTSHGTWALICPPATNSSGAAMPLKVTDVAPSCVEKIGR